MNYRKHTRPQRETSVRVCRMYDRSGAGSVNFEEFNQLHQFIVQTQNDFRMIDHNKDGLLSKQEVSDALSRAGAFLYCFSISSPSRSTAPWPHVATADQSFRFGAVAMIGEVDAAPRPGSGCTCPCCMFLSVFIFCCPRLL